MNKLQQLFTKNISILKNYISIERKNYSNSQEQTTSAFSEKWIQYEQTSDKDKLYDAQKKWYLDLYGFDSEEHLANFLKDKAYILDAGCGLGYKAKWFSELSPQSIVVGMDLSDSVKIATLNYQNYDNLYFIQGDISDTNINKNSFDYISCDQVIMHTDNPEKTFSELTRVLKQKGSFSCYVYAKKALPRELLDEHFRNYCRELNNNELWNMSKNLTQLGKTLSDLKINIDVPDIPEMGIEGGNYDLQRFIYWNFLKCFWNEELGWDTSIACNFDWYSPTNAKRYSKEEYKKIISDNNLMIEYFHSEPACYSGRFKK